MSDGLILPKHDIKHVAFIPDGNRGWAKQNGVPVYEGHRAGTEKFKEVLGWLKELEIPTATFYAISAENIEARDSQELEGLYQIFDHFYGECVDDKFAEYSVRLRFMGDLDRVPQLKEKALELEARTEQYKEYTVNLALAYGGRQEIVQAFNGLLGEKARASDFSKVTEDDIERHLYTSGQLHPDLIIRTSQRRLSGFLLWQVAYSQIEFLPDVAWPDFSKNDLIGCIDRYNASVRKFGK